MGNPATTSCTSCCGAANQRRGAIRATPMETPAGAARNKRRTSSHGSHPTRKTKHPRQDNDTSGSFLTRDNVPAVIEAVRDASRLDSDALSTPSHPSTSTPPTTVEEFQQQELGKQ